MRSAILHTEHWEAFASSSTDKASVEANKIKRDWIVIGRDQCCCQLQAVGCA